MKIDITLLTEDELIDLHRKITERLRFLSQTRAHNKMLQFMVGDRVSFKPDERPALCGVLPNITRRPSRSSPTTGNTGTSRGLLTIAKDAKVLDKKQSNIIQMPKL